MTTELQSELVPFLKPQDRETLVDRASLLEAVLLDVLIARCHSTEDEDFPVMEMTGDLNTVLRGRGDMREVSPERVGWTLPGPWFPYGVHYRREGRGCCFRNDVREKIHHLAGAFGARTIRELPAGS